MVTALHSPSPPACYTHCLAGQPIITYSYSSSYSYSYSFILLNRAQVSEQALLATQSLGFGYRASLRSHRVTVWPRAGVGAAKGRGGGGRGGEGRGGANCGPQGWGVPGKG